VVKGSSGSEEAGGAHGVCGDKAGKREGVGAELQQRTPKKMKHFLAPSTTLCPSLKLRSKENEAFSRTFNNFVSVP
jgi:hypothetical protein